MSGRKQPKNLTAGNQLLRGETNSDNATKGNSNVFIKPDYGQSYLKSCRVKRATVVGNPMFSSSIEDDNNDEECLSLDDLDMDYEQIMHYFDNLKESNA